MEAQKLISISNVQLFSVSCLLLVVFKVWCAVLAVESVCTWYSLVYQQVVSLKATGWREVTASGLVAKIQQSLSPKFSNPCR